MPADQHHHTDAPPSTPAGRRRLRNAPLLGIPPFTLSLLRLGLAPRLRIAAVAVVFVWALILPVLGYGR